MGTSGQRTPNGSRDGITAPSTRQVTGSTRSTNGSSADWVRAAVVAPDEFVSELLVHRLMFLGITVMARTADPSAAAALASPPVEVLVRFVSTDDGEVDLGELHAARAVSPNIGLVVLTLTRDIRLLGLTVRSLPPGTRVLSVNDAGSMDRLPDLIRSAVLNPLAAQRQMMRLPLTDEQVAALRAVAAGLSNEQFAAARSTTVSAARQLVNRTARALGIPPRTSPSQVRAMLGVSHQRLLSGARIPWRGPDATLRAEPR